MLIKKTTLILAVVQILWNIILIAPLNVQIIITGGGPWGFGIMLTPITITLTIFSVIAFVYSLMKLNELENSKKGLILNGLAFTMIFLFITLIMLPVEPFLPELIKSVWSWS